MHPQYVSFTILYIVYITSGILCNTKIADLALVVRNTDVAGDHALSPMSRTGWPLFLKRLRKIPDTESTLLDYLGDRFQCWYERSTPRWDQRQDGCWHIEETFIVSRPYGHRYKQLLSQEPWDAPKSNDLHRCRWWALYHLLLEELEVLILKLTRKDVGTNTQRARWQRNKMVRKDWWIPNSWIRIISKSFITTRASLGMLRIVRVSSMSPSGMDGLETGLFMGWTRLFDPATLSLLISACFMVRLLLAAGSETLRKFFYRHQRFSPSGRWYL